MAARIPTAAERFADSERAVATEPATAYGALVRRHRRDRGWSQAMLAERADVGQSYVSRLESGDRGHDQPVGTVARLARALNLSRRQWYELVDAAAGRTGR